MTTAGTKKDQRGERRSCECYLEVEEQVIACVPGVAAVYIAVLLARADRTDETLHPVLEIVLQSAHTHGKAATECNTLKAGAGPTCDAA